MMTRILLGVLAGMVATGINAADVEADAVQNGHERRLTAVVLPRGKQQGEQ